MSNRLYWPAFVSFFVMAFGCGVHGQVPPGPGLAEVGKAEVSPSGKLAMSYQQPSIALGKEKDPQNLSLSEQRRFLQLAQKDSLGLLSLAMTNYREHIKTYTATFYKQERIDGKLQPRQKISVWFKQEPYSVLMKWDENPTNIDKLLYQEGSYKDEMIIHPTGLFFWIPSVRRAPDCAEAKKSSLNTCNRFGFYRMMESLLEVGQTAHERNDLQVRYLGATKVMGRTCIAIERSLPRRAGYPCARSVVEFDVENALPISVTSYDWQGKLLSRYMFADVKINAAIPDQVFTPDGNGM